jgi:hypothetical protein
LENKTFFDISNGVRKNFLNLNVADIGAKNAFLSMFYEEFVREKVF